jgi:hypothetical protein
MVETRLQGRAMTERIFGPFGDSFDDAISRLEAAVTNSEAEAKMRNITLEVLLNGTSFARRRLDEITSEQRTT